MTAVVVVVVDEIGPVVVVETVTVVVDVDIVVVAVVGMEEIVAELELSKLWEDNDDVDEGATRVVELSLAVCCGNREPTLRARTKATTTAMVAPAPICFLYSDNRTGLG